MFWSLFLSWVILVFMSNLRITCFLNVFDRKSLIELMYFYMLFQGLIAVNYVGYLICSSFPTQSNGRIVVELELLLVTESIWVGHTRQLASLTHEKLHIWRLMLFNATRRTGGLAPHWFALNTMHPLFWCLYMIEFEREWGIME